ncbi:MAG: hypothetical protein HQK77_22500 [Desulfobacterales bacterium]|nr:hypothetical protein [Desulfobacterales bacterium]
MQISELSEGAKSIIKDSVSKMTGSKRREYLAAVTIEFFDGNARKAERAKPFALRSNSFL